MPIRDEALIADPAAGWDAAAAAWDDFVETGLDYWRTDVHGPALLAACGDVHGRRVLDVGCGQGWFSRQLAARGALAPGGRMAFSIVHPVGAAPHSAWDAADDGEKGRRCFDHSFDAGPYVVNWAMTRLTTHWATASWHRTLTEWSGLIADAGFAIGRLDEPRPTPAQVAQNPKLAPAARIPFFLVFVIQPMP